MTRKQKQWQLYYLGYYGGAIDVIWGAGSKAATVRWQTEVRYAYAIDANYVHMDIL